MDEFPQRKQATQNLDDKFDFSQYTSVMEMVVQCLLTKAMHEYRKQDQYNPTYLGNVLFHLEYNELTKETRLAFDKHPKTWKIKEIINEVHNLEADMMMEQQSQKDILDNPFTY